MKSERSESYSQAIFRYRQYLFRSDFFIVITATLLTYAFRFQGLGDIAHKSVNNFLLVCALPLLWLFSLQICNTWNFSTVEDRRKALDSVFQASWRATVFVGFASYLLHDSISRLWVFLTSGVIVLCLAASRLLVDYFFTRSYRTSIQETYLVIARGSQEMEGDLIPPRRDTAGHQVRYLWMAPPDVFQDEKWLEDLESRIAEESIDGIIIMPSAGVGGDLLVRISKFYYMGITEILLSTPLAAELTLFRPISHQNWVRIEEPQIVNSGYAVKRVFDMIFALVVLTALSPVLLLIAIGVKITSKGPVIYKAKRMGSHGIYFDFPKFRTMVENADTFRSDVIGKPDENIAERYRLDPRITPFGRFLRRWSLDELPQLWCVLIGTMSVVGPRPILEEEYSLVGHKSRFRSIATPGLTGLWQVSGRKEVDWQERMNMDTQYIQNWSFLHDMLLILKTFVPILTGHGSY